MSNNGNKKQQNNNGMNSKAERGCKSNWKLWINPKMFSKAEQQELVGLGYIPVSSTFTPSNNQFWEPPPLKYMNELEKMIAYCSIVGEALDMGKFPLPSLIQPKCYK
tara:strand:- start:257 stop:577 length:321 start_codon:yes stop_codon:yes gene_type:complete